MNDYGHWDLLVNDFDPGMYFGFIYFIFDKINNMKYIGKRNFRVKSRAKHSWKSYTGSQKHLTAAISALGKDKFDFVIVELCTSKDELNNREHELHILNNVLKAKYSDGKKLFYNRTISNKSFDSSGIKRKDWIKTSKVYKSYTFINIYTVELFVGSHIDLANKLDIPSKKVMSLVRNKCNSVAGWAMQYADISVIRKRQRTVKNTTTNEVFTGTPSDIIQHIGTSASCFKDLCAGSQKSTRGWILV